MSDTAFVVPAKGRRVPLEDGTGHFPAEGRETPVTRYVRRRLADGDLVKSKPPAAAKAEGEGGRKAKS